MATTAEKIWSDDRRKETRPVENDFFSWKGALFWNFKRVFVRWESYVSRYEKKLKDKLDAEIKLAEC